MADASGHLRVEVVSPEKVLFSGVARQVITRTLGGAKLRSCQDTHHFLELSARTTRVCISLTELCKTLPYILALSKLVPITCRFSATLQNSHKTSMWHVLKKQSAVPKNSFAPNTLPKVKRPCVAHMRVCPPLVDLARHTNAPIRVGHS